MDSETFYCDRREGWGGVGAEETGSRGAGGGGREGGDWKVRMAWGTAAVTESLESCYCDGIRKEVGGEEGGGDWRVRMAWGTAAVTESLESCYCDGIRREGRRGGGGGRGGGGKIGGWGWHGELPL